MVPDACPSVHHGPGPNVRAFTDHDGLDVHVRSLKPPDVQDPTYFGSCLDVHGIEVANEDADAGRPGDLQVRFMRVLVPGLKLGVRSRGGRMVPTMPSSRTCRKNGCLPAKSFLHAGENTVKTGANQKAWVSHLCAHTAINEDHQLRIKHPTSTDALPGI